MNYKLLFCLLLLFGCRSNSANKEKQPIIANIVEPKHPFPEVWKQFSTIDSIPKILIRKLDSINGENFKLANPEEEFQATDAVIINKSQDGAVAPELPWRQLRFLGSCDSFWIMTYKHGGIGLHYHFVLCKIIDNEIKFFRTGVSVLDLETIIQIKRAMGEQRIEFKDIESKEIIDPV